MYTFFLYLNDVEEGGGTRFDLGFTVQPKKGKAVLWPATHNERPFEQARLAVAARRAFLRAPRARATREHPARAQDHRTHHEALPVTKGTKYAANFWIHQYDYVTAHHQGCTA